MSFGAEGRIPISDNIDNGFCSNRWRGAARKAAPAIPAAAPAERPADGPSKATIADLAWIPGPWRVEGLGGCGDEIRSRPDAGTTVGSFRFIHDKQVTFYEIFVVIESRGSLLIKPVRAFQKALPAKGLEVDIRFLPSGGHATLTSGWYGEDTVAVSSGYYFLRIRVKKRRAVPPPRGLYVEIGKRIRHARERAKLRQDELAKRVGVTRGSITNIEIGRQSVQIHTLYAIADALQTTVEPLLPNLRGALKELEPSIKPSGKEVRKQKVTPEELQWIRELGE